MDRQGKSKRELQGEGYLRELWNFLAGLEAIATTLLEIVDQCVGFVGQKRFKTHFTIRSTRLEAAG